MTFRYDGSVRNDLNDWIPDVMCIYNVAGYFTQKSTSN